MSVAGVRGAARRSAQLFRLTLCGRWLNFGTLIEWMPIFMAGRWSKPKPSSANSVSLPIFGSPFPKIIFRHLLLTPLPLGEGQG